MESEEIKKLKNSLRILKKFNGKRINYRILGSVLIAAINNKPHRTLGDIDVLLDKKDKNKTFKIMKESGFKFEEKKKFGFSWIEAVKPKNLNFTFLLIGKFHKDYFSYRLGKYLELTISITYLAPYKYKLFGTEFIGISPESVYEGVRISNLNPKRKLDKKILSKISFNEYKKRISISKTFRIYIARIKIPSLYLIFSYIYNIYGGIRVLLGKNYEIWN